MIRRRSLTLLFAVLAVLAVSTTGWAYWTATGTGAAAASVASFNAPTNVTATGGTNQAEVTWTGSALSNGTRAEGYYVERLGGVSSPAPACGTSAANSSTHIADATGTITCTDSGVPAGIYTYRVTAVYRSWTAQSAASAPATVTATVHHFAVLATPAVTTAGSPVSVKVIAQDADGNTVTGYVGTIHFTSSDGQAILPADYTFGASDNGQHTFSAATLKTAGSQTIAVNDTAQTSKTGSATIAVHAAAASSLVLSGFPNPATAGTAGNFTVIAKDTYGNTATGYTGTLQFTSSDSQAVLPSSYAFTSADSGTHSFSATLKTAGTRSIIATDVANGALVGSQTGITVNAAAASKLVFTTSPAGTITNGTAFPTQPVVAVQDQFGNTATSDSGAVTLSITSGTGTAGAALTCSANPVNASSGAATFSGCKVDKAGSGYTLTASRTGLTSGTSSSFTVAAGSATRLVVSASATTIAAGGTSNLTITAVDAGGNTVSSYTGSHSLTFGGAGASPAGTTPTVTSSSGTAIAFGTATPISFTNGTATVSGGSNGVMTLYKAETANISVTDTANSLSNSGNLLSVTVTPGTPSKLAWSAPTVTGTLLSCGPAAFTCSWTGANNKTWTSGVSVTDAAGNIVQNLAGTHAVTLSGTRKTPSPTSLPVPTSGPATTTTTFTYGADNGNWTTDTLTASSTDGYASATVGISH